MYNFALGVYTKYGGTPWILNETLLANSCFLGISSHLDRKDKYSSHERTLFGIAEITDEFGNHLNMKISHEVHTQEMLDNRLKKYKSLTLTESLTEDLVKKTLRYYINKNKTPIPQHLIIHKTTPFTEEEFNGIESALDALEVKIDVSLIHIKENTIARLYHKLDKDSRRGIFLQKSETEGILWTVGKLTSYYNGYIEKGKTKLGTSNPIGISLFNDSPLSIKELAKQVMALTRMRWHSIDRNVREPATLYYAKEYGKFLANIWEEDMGIEIRGRDVRYFM